MAEDLPYMLGVKNLDAILDKIKTAGTPPKFSVDFLKTSLGFTSSSDRGVIKVLRALGFLSADSTPTARYNEFRQAQTSGRALAVGLREGWAPIFLADQQAHTRTSTQLKEIFKNVTGKAESVAEKMATTFKALAQKADFAAVPTAAVPVTTPPGEEPLPEKPEAAGAPLAPSGMSLHHDIHLHLPPSSDVAVYTAIFRALREELLD
jgi:uncharacterized protein DUF5343